MHNNMVVGETEDRLMTSISLSKNHSMVDQFMLDDPQMTKRKEMLNEKKDRQESSSHGTELDVGIQLKGKRKAYPSSSSNMRKKQKESNIINTEDESEEEIVDLYGGTNICPHMDEVMEINESTKDWKIKVQLLQKLEPKVAKNKTTTFQTILFVDEKGDKIQAKVFNEDIAIFDSLIRTNEVYFISNATVQQVPAQYRCVDNENQLIFNRHTTIERIQEEPFKIPNDRYQFVPLRNLEQLQQNGKSFDVLVAVLQIGKAKLIDKVNAVVRHLVVIDRETIENKDTLEQLRNPRFPDIWKGAHDFIQPQHVPNLIEAIQCEEGIVYHVRACIAQIERPLYYMGCQYCHKKTLELYQKNFHCSNCNNEKAISTPFFAVRLKLTDGEHSTRVTLFGDVAESLLKCNAKEFMEIDLQVDTEKKRKICHLEVENLVGKEYYFDLDCSKNEFPGARRLTVLSVSEK
ncbi:hypothetical protein QJS10_CPA10g00705 [Acorus calamus]|uniref:Replication factor A C-terminal domain-containing protein n=1 Tax=Acorus calamus TaxID=4465 RepID=A0AAV9CJD5_ACOCL|nr:hypothetical protein QJS10_CPB19g01071 [Acorus calamus]KAK1306312.1 hypothetical protein QJS10_CPA10g00705 [Acorus calamus]